MLPLDPGETITSVMALPEDEADWALLDVMFVTKSGQVRRNKLSDFTQVNRAGKIAMKPDEGDGIVAVKTQLCAVFPQKLAVAQTKQQWHQRIDVVHVDVLEAGEPRGGKHPPSAWTYQQ
jgi:DNA gyrase/topoisomerase IV subunit A